MRERTLLVEQRNIDGAIVGGQKVRCFHPRAIDLLEPVKRDIREYLLATGIRSGLLFPRPDGKPWRSHDWKNWCRRVWHKAREAAGIERLPPYDLRHAFASLQIRAGLSIPELATGSRVLIDPLQHRPTHGCASSAGTSPPSSSGPATS